MDNLIKDTIEKIKKQHIAPEPRWKYLAKKYAAWALLLVFVLLGAISVSVAWFLLTSLDWDLAPLMHQNTFSYGVSVFPYFWALLLGIFLMAAFFGIRKSETGYRFSWLKILLVTIGGMVISGIFFINTGLGGRFNNMMNGVPYYAHSMMSRQTQWMQPEKGLLSGTIKSVSGNELILEDFNGASWKIQMDDKTLVRPLADVTVGQSIKIIGIKKADNIFAATEIRPWTGMGMGAGQGRGMMGGGQRGGMMR